MSILGVVEGVASIAGKIIDRFAPEKMKDADRAKAVLDISAMIDERDNTLVNAQRDVIVAELEQGDKFTKRARPMIVYTGLAVLVFNHALVPFINRCVEWYVLAQGGDLEGAKRELKIVLKSDPGHSYAATLLTRLEGP